MADHYGVSELSRQWLGPDAEHEDEVRKAS